MKKSIRLSVVLAFLAIAAIAGDIYTFPIFTQTWTDRLLQTWTASYTNTVGERLLIKSVWLTGDNLTNGSMKIANSTSITNDLPVTLTAPTLSYTPEGGSIWLEPSGRIWLTGVVNTNTALTNNLSVSVYATRPST